MPKQTDRRFPNLLRAFGVLGAGQGDEIRLPVAGACSPTVEVDEYDPAPLFGVSVLNLGLAGNFAWIEIEARPWARLVSLMVGTFSASVSRRAAFTAGGTPVVASSAFPFSSNGTEPRMRVQTGVSVAATPGVQLISGNAWPPVKPIHWEGVIHLEAVLVGTQYRIDGFAQEQRDA